MSENKEIVLDGMKEFKEYLEEHADGQTIISVVVEMTGTGIREGGADDGE